MTRINWPALRQGLGIQAPILLANALLTALYFAGPWLHGWGFALTVTWAVAAVWVAVGYQGALLQAERENRAYQRGQLDKELEVTAELRRVATENATTEVTE